MIKLMSSIFYMLPSAKGGCSVTTKQAINMGPRGHLYGTHMGCLYGTNIESATGAFVIWAAHMHSIWDPYGSHLGYHMYIRLGCLYGSHLGCQYSFRNGTHMGSLYSYEHFRYTVNQKLYFSANTTLSSGLRLLCVHSVLAGRSS